MVKCSVVRFALIAGFLLVAETTSAYHAGGPSLQISPAVRSEGMGRAYAPLEISPFAAWANPGALGFIKGVQAATFRARLVPDLSPGVHQNYKAVIGGTTLDGRIPFNLSLGFNNTFLDYGESFAPELGEFSSFERTKGVTAAVGIRDLVGIGFGVKRFMGSFTGLPEHEGRATLHDFGVLGRTPLLPFRAKGESRPVDASLAMGVSWLNHGNDIRFPERSAAGDPPPKVRRESLGFEVGFFPALDHIKTSNKWLSGILRDTHLISVSAAIGREKDLLAFEHDIPDSIRATLSKNDIEGISTYRGAEVRFLDTVALRIGHINDEAGGIIGETYGWGFSLLGVAGVDYARIPQFRTLEHVVKWAFWIRVPLDASF